MSRKRLAALAGVAAVFLIGGTSLALTGEWDFVSGYDEQNDVLVYGLSEVSTTTGTTDTTAAATGCAALDGTTVSYGGTTTTTAPPSGEGCELRVVEVANENGVVNHGQVVSSFVDDLKEAGVKGGIGCVVREIAGSDYGKGDDDVTETTVTTTTVLSGEVDLTSETVSCGRPEHAGQGDEDDEQGGRPDHAGPPDHAGGNGNGNGG